MDGEKVLTVVIGVLAVAGIVILSILPGVTTKALDEYKEKQYYASQTCDICGEPTAGKTIYQIKGASCIIQV